MNSNACTAEWPHQGHPVLTIDPSARVVSVRFVRPVPTYCPSVWVPVNGVEGSFGRLAAGRWTFSMAPHGEYGFEVRECPPAGLTIASWTGKGILAWTNCPAATGYCTVEIAESLAEGWRPAPYWSYRDVAITTGGGAIDLPLAHEWTSEGCSASLARKLSIRR